ncbi:hypothetical protein GLW08_11490 [Pontibacillus yanchengensis]|uniref:Uncharacterized protein n=2 Tax=Pontibacillus yanchengensis TaxID=462910 RepID=A0ACC7VGZ1_9BACI|nr:DUF6305 family protein [Pontibacillus yanchengensis]MYL33927.1 hypothetical protein [Pontibacillus yanchengensis]MYL53960.1 hypothetical protein [Pontibacillus yanchengensis]
MKKYSIAIILLLIFIGTIFLQSRSVSPETKHTWPNLPAPIGEEPILITSAGQATEGKVFSYVTKDLHFEADYRPRALARDLYEYETLVLVTGYSPHGLNQTYRSIKEEKQRVDKLLQQAERKPIPIIVVHVGGAARDDEYTWEFLRQSIPYADYVIGLRQMEQSNQLQQLAKKHSVPVTLVEELDDIRTPFNSAFR